MDLRDQPGPCCAGLSGGDEGFSALQIGEADAKRFLWRVLLPPALRSEAYQVRFAQPCTAGAGRVQPVTTNQAQTGVRQVLHQLGDEVGGGEELAVGA